MLCSIQRSITKKVPKILASSLRQISECDQPTDIITHPPTVATQFPFHLEAFLFDTPPDPAAAHLCHESFQTALAQISGAKVWNVIDVLKKLSHKELRAILMETCDIAFNVDTDIKIDPIAKEISPEYIDYSLSQLSKHDLLDLILLNPSIRIKVDKSSTGFSYKTIPVSPLSNMLFTRDQQIATANGVVMGRFNAPQRTTEIALMNQVMPLLGVQPIGAIGDPGHLEGGDFFPLGYDMSMLGVGLRTTAEAARQLMRNDLVGTQKFVVVEDTHDRNPTRAHLDTVFNVIDEKTCICLDAIADDAPDFMRTARVYVKHDSHYVEEEKMPFGKFLVKEGFKVVKCSMKQQAEYVPNFINLGKDSHGKARILINNTELQTLLKANDVNINCYDIDFAAISSMSGGPRSSTFVLRAESK
ncbi:amidinotransferase family [Trichomonas vaginalis G3]|uniref:amidinotransferase family n=1 Tax=Trichomonas vaginalis (strain ATCC PRA-98 / G3) TaxID=412133 RepID=UPI0021E60013|nr:amidinotransferase family [Trichomonas vaginalis G3]KAI5513785.1 amidinotransferase family [Trichomonas vaginalis G3]